MTSVAHGFRAGPGWSEVALFLWVGQEVWNPDCLLSVPFRFPCLGGVAPGKGNLDLRSDDFSRLDRIRARTFAPHVAEFERNGQRYRVPMEIESMGEGA